jgi:hypothetical protein
MTLYPGPCSICGLTNYPLSAGGEMICPSCDCGNFGLKKIEAQRDEISRLRRELTEALQAQREAAWQPIETAPKDRRVLGFHPSHGVGLMFWQTMTVGQPYADEAVETSGWRILGMFIAPGDFDQPTHWQPLPAPPAAIRDVK